MEQNKLPLEVHLSLKRVARWVKEGSLSAEYGVGYKEGIEIMHKELMTLRAKCDRYEIALKNIQIWCKESGLKQVAIGDKKGMTIYHSLHLANEALSAGGNSKHDKEGLIRLMLANAEEVSKNIETARAYLESEGVDMGNLKEDVKFVTWLAELAKLLHGAADGQPIKINHDEARKWFDDGMTAYQCFRETWNME